MIKIDYLNPKMLIASEGKILKKGEQYSSVVYLGVNSTADEWEEVDLSEKPEQKLPKTKKAPGEKGEVE